ncbi:hypothetical protein BKA65DRAFT_533797 [Rhexocercosporidium sp. MPI-PUGE-AT-0058]|nr:hypothetical protein BKA65DRAFT_533797 [Rhexocercosporidium sp. MPI-PUGE-AT-0058]
MIHSIVHLSPVPFLAALGVSSRSPQQQANRLSPGGDGVCQPERATLPPALKTQPTPSLQSFGYLGLSAILQPYKQENSQVWQSLARTQCRNEPAARLAFRYKKLGIRDPSSSASDWQCNVLLKQCVGHLAALLFLNTARSFERLAHFSSLCQVVKKASLAGLGYLLVAGPD